MGPKAAETTCNINNTFIPGPADVQVRWWFRKVSKGDESFEDEEHGGWRSEGDNNQLRATIKADLHTATRVVATEFNVYYSTVVWHLKQIGKVKKLDNWVPRELTLNQSNGHFSSVVFSYST